MNESIIQTIEPTEPTEVLYDDMMPKVGWNPDYYVPGSDGEVSVRPLTRAQRDEIARSNSDQNFVNTNEDN